MLKFTKILTVVLVIAVGALIFYFNQPSPQAAPGPKINWNLTNITDIISPGESKSVEVSFIATKDLKNVEVFVVPELQPYVQVSPQSFSHVSAGTVTPLTIMFSAPSNAELGTFDGTIHINSTEKKKTYSQPLPIKISISLLNGIFSETNLGITFRYPTFSQPSIVDIRGVEEGIVTVDIKLPSAFVDLKVSFFNFAFIENEDHLKLRKWFEQNIDLSETLLSSGAFKKERLKNGMDIFISVGPVPDEHANNYGPVSTIYAELPYEHMIISGTLSQVHELDLYGFITPDEQVDLLRAIFESMTSAGE